jgi:protein SCO1/2
MQNAEGFSRRSLLRAALVANLHPLLGAAPGIIKADHGQIKPPMPLPDMELVRHNGARTRLLPLVDGHVTAVQLIFTRCTTTCPIEGSIFQRVQKLLPDMAQRGIQLLSLSNDPEEDGPKALSAWLRRFHAGPNWIAAAPLGADLAKLNEIFGKSSDSADHSTQVQILDRHGRLVWRTFELPRAEEIALILQKV